MYVGICDDDPDYQAEISKLIKEQNVSVPVEVIIFSKMEELLHSVHPLDILFLDIELGAENSFAYLNKHDCTLSVPIIVLVSSNSYYVTKSYQMSVFQYLLKPLQAQIFHQVFSDCCKKYDRLNQRCELWDEQGILYQVSLNKIAYMKREHRKIVYYDEREIGYYGSDSSLSAVLQKLQVYGFCQITKSYLVNFAYVADIEKKSIILQLQQKTITLPLSKKYLTQIKTQYLEYIANQ